MVLIRKICNSFWLANGRVDVLDALLGGHDQIWDVRHDLLALDFLVALVGRLDDLVVAVGDDVAFH